MRKVLGKVMKIGKTTALCAGLAVMVVVTVGMASPATAAKAKKATFKLGKTNAVKAVSAMAGSVAGPLLKLDNNGGGPALELQVGRVMPP